MKILIIKLSAMGDVLFALPVAADICRHYPGAQVDWVVDERFAAVSDLSTYVNTVFSVPLRQLKGGGRWKSLRALISAIGRIRRQRYDMVIDLQGVGKSSLLTWLARARQKWGYRNQDMAESIFSWAYSHRFARIAGEHACAAYRHALEQVLGVQFPAVLDFGLRSPVLRGPAGGGNPEAAPAQISHGLRLAMEQVARAPCPVLFFPFASKQKKWIPPAQSAEILRRLSAGGAQVFFLTGAPEEAQQAKELADAHGARVLAALSIAEFTALLPHIAGFVGADTGVSHLAAAFGRPTVTVFRATKIERYGPDKWARVGASLHVGTPDWQANLNKTISWLFSKFAARV